MRSLRTLRSVIVNTVATTSPSGFSRGIDNACVDEVNEATGTRCWRSHSKRHDLRRELRQEALARCNHHARHTNLRRSWLLEDQPKHLQDDLYLALSALFGRKPRMPQPLSPPLSNHNARLRAAAPHTLGVQQRTAPLPPYSFLVVVTAVAKAIVTATVVAKVTA